MNQNLTYLDGLIKSLVIDPSEESEYINLAQKIRSHWKDRLSKIFPLTTKQLSAFDYESYFTKFPPTHWNTLNFGSEFPLYLKELGLNKKLERYVHELCELEWGKYWVKFAPQFKTQSDKYCHNPFIRVLRFEHSILSWIGTDLEKPEVKPEQLVVSRDLSGELAVFEPTLVESVIYDLVHEMALNKDQIVTHMLSTRPELQASEVDLALKSLVDRGVLIEPQ